MSELSGMAKIKQLLGHAAIEHYGCWLNGFDVIEILGHIESLEETIRLSEPSQPDVSATQNNKCVWKHEIIHFKDCDIIGIRTQCGELRDGLPHSMTKCPYCGKEIEEAE